MASAAEQMAVVAVAIVAAVVAVAIVAAVVAVAIVTAVVAVAIVWPWSRSLRPGRVAVAIVTAVVAVAIVAAVTWSLIGLRPVVAACSRARAGLLAVPAAVVAVACGRSRGRPAR